jgi:uncharacterized 2Fe-2S/4Fe-4S cluster protein (DUF4445 family)
MLSLLTGQNCSLLLDPRNWSEFIDCLPNDTDFWRTCWGIDPAAHIEVIPPVAGFIGSDLLAGVQATRLMEDGPGALLIDFGTNSEMALWDGAHLWVTSAAGGPAFEGCGISCGIPAEPGAVWRVTIDTESGELQYSTIADAALRGVCGSGLVDLLACLITSGALNRKGQFAASVPESGFPLSSGVKGLALTKRDIDIFQRAKAAIGVAINVLLTKADMKHDDLRRICIGGVFGQYLNVANAQKIGLLPPVAEELVETSGNTALAGAEALLFSSRHGERLNEARRLARIENLSDCTDFAALFLDHLFLQPSPGKRP